MELNPGCFPSIPGEQHTKIGELTADIKECSRKLRKCLLLIPLLGILSRRNSTRSMLGSGFASLFAGKQAAELEERDVTIRENEAEIRRLTELLGTCFPGHKSHGKRADNGIKWDLFPLAESQDSGIHGSSEEPGKAPASFRLENWDGLHQFLCWSMGGTANEG
ncbi:uncharacterized protein AAGF69_015197 isoform 1-T3 [Amazona ochrocephala]